MISRVGTRLLAHEDAVRVYADVSGEAMAVAGDKAMESTMRRLREEIARQAAWAAAEKLAAAFALCTYLGRFAR